MLIPRRLIAVAFYLSYSASAQESGGSPIPTHELDECVSYFSQCITSFASSNAEGDKDEEDLAFSILGSWLKELYVRDEEPRLAEDLNFRAVILARLQDLVTLASTKPSISIAVGQMLFLYFWWGVQPPPNGAQILTGGRQRNRGPDLAVVSVAAHLHVLSLQVSRCDAPATSLEDFAAKHCPWRWRFVLMLFVELGRKLVIEQREVVAGATHLRLAQRHLHTMRSLPFFAAHKSLLEGPSRSNQNDDFFPQARHRPVWPRDMWPSFATFLEDHAHIFHAELMRMIHVDEEDELFRVVQGQQTEFTPLPADWGLLDLVRSGNVTSACPYAPASCELLKDRPEVNGRCFSERVPNAGVAFARLLPGAEIKPHFATEPRIAVHLGLVTPPGPVMAVADERARWTEGHAVVFDDTYVHSVLHEGSEPRFILLAWTCHPCDLEWRSGIDEAWLAENPLPSWCHESG